jgi:hypothetical protein
MFIQVADYVNVISTEALSELSISARPSSKSIIYHHLVESLINMILQSTSSTSVRLLE